MAAAVDIVAHCIEVTVNAHGNSGQNTGQDAGHQEFCNRGVGGSAVNHKHDTGGDYDSQCAAHHWQRCGISFIITVFEQFGIHDGADGRRSSYGRTGQCSKEHACYNGDDRQAAPDRPGDCLCKCDEPCSDTTMLHDCTG